MVTWLVMDPNDLFDVDSLLSDEGLIKTELQENQAKKTRQKLKPWLMEQINSGTYPGLEWINQKEQIFKIPWKHFGKPGDFDINNAMLFRYSLLLLLFKECFMC